MRRPAQLGSVDGGILEESVRRFPRRTGGEQLRDLAGWRRSRRRRHLDQPTGSSLIPQACPTKFPCCPQHLTHVWHASFDHKTKPTAKLWLTISSPAPCEWKLMEMPPKSVACAIRRRWRWVLGSRDRSF